MTEFKRLMLLVLLMAAVLAGTAEIQLSEDLYRNAKARTVTPADDFISRTIQRFNDSWQWAFYEFDQAKQTAKEAPAKLENKLRESVRESVDSAIDDAKKNLIPASAPASPGENDENDEAEESED